MIGVIGMLFIGVLNMDEVYKVINWKMIFVIVCLILLGWLMDVIGIVVWLV